ncbi:AMP-dependent synthetase (plasmid) [Rhodococcus opacus]|uniref:AMP-dependent synthetase n=1 Tax=Rhodococcus opacus TaxID=37919 RepID=A0A076EY97_RHOOP|nr:AMP-dependent synthetase [Rhodococcus opacus]
MDADTPVSDIDRAAQVWGSTTTDAEYAGHPGIVYEPRPRTFDDLVCTTGRWSERTYLVQGQRRVSFREFGNARSAAADFLAARGIGRGDRVLLLAYNSPEWALALWSLWTIGALPVLGNRWWSAHEIEHAVTVTEPTLIITDIPELPESITVQTEPISGLISCFETADRPDRGFDSAPDEDAPALILFTSGSSGRPKAVELSRRSVLSNQQNLLLRSRRLPQDLPTEAQPGSTLLCTPLFHIGGVSNLLTQFICGGKIVLNEGRFDAGQVLRLIEEEKVQSWGGVPTMASRVLEHPDFDRHDLSSLRSWPLGGAPLPQGLLERMQNRLPQLRTRGLGNTWGMTESGGFLTVAGNRDLEKYPGTVGRPYNVVELRISEPDRDGIGEILVRSPTIMLRYIGVDDGTIDDRGWLHTGDLGHINNDGYLFIDGRSKDIVIRGGENIACAHVEAALSVHPDIVEVAVVGLPHPDLGEELAAVVVHRVGTPAPDPEDLRSMLSGTLAYFEIPTRWDIRHEPLPTLAGEKTDKKALVTTFPTVDQ